MSEIIFFLLFGGACGAAITLLIVSTKCEKYHGCSSDKAKWEDNKGRHIKEGLEIEKKYPLGSQWMYLDRIVYIGAYNYWDVSGFGNYKYTKGVEIVWEGSDSYLKKEVINRYEIMNEKNCVLKKEK